VIFRLFPTLCAVLGWLMFFNPVFAQRVQFPTADANNLGAIYPPQSPVTPQPQLSNPGYSNFDPYMNPALGAPPADIPYNVSPQFGQPMLPQAAPPSVPPIPQQGASLFPHGLPWQQESGVYNYQNTDGSVARLQRLMQQIGWEHTWLRASSRDDAFGVNRSELYVTFGFPVFFNPDTPLLVTPGFAFNWLDGPDVPEADMPSRVYDAYLDAAWHPRFNDWFSADLGVRTGVWTDFNEVNSDSVRILGRGLGVLAFTPNMDILLGAWYLDRNRIKMLPAGGVHWRPTSHLDAYLVFPNPKVRMRSITMGASQWWVYFAGEYGGGRWTVERDIYDPVLDDFVRGGDDVDYNDIRVVFGIEWETLTQARGHFEVGYVFDRELYFGGSDTPTQSLEDTIMLRAGINF